MKQDKILFIDRDGTLIVEPMDQQIDSIEKLELLPGVINALQTLQNSGYQFVMISNQDGLGRPSFPEADFLAPQQLLLKILSSQGITFTDVRICPHTAEDNCDCRKPKVGCVLDYLQSQIIQRDTSYVIGDRDTDLEFASNLGIRGIKIGSCDWPDWPAIVEAILQQDRTANSSRTTNETCITVTINLDNPNTINIDTGLPFFDHMLEQLAKHANISMSVTCQGDLAVDEHHTIEDCALVIGAAIKSALGDKFGIARYGFVLPMDESLAHCAIDLSGRPYLQMRANFPEASVGTLSTTMIPHFFRSFSDALGANIHLSVTGENTHHMVEASFKAIGRCLRQAFAQQTNSLPTTKGVL